MFRLFAGLVRALKSMQAVRFRGHHDRVTRVEVHEDRNGRALGLPVRIPDSGQTSFDLESVTPKAPSSKPGPALLTTSCFYSDPTQ